MIYLDYQATTPLAPEAQAAMLAWLSDAPAVEILADKLDSGFANPSSAHRAGRAAAAAVEHARDQVAALLPSGGRVYFTSTATEALNWALVSGTQRRKGGIASLSIEHPAVVQCVARLEAQGYAVTELAVDSTGLAEAVEDTALPAEGIVTSMLVNNEVGTIQDIASLAQQAHRRGSWLLCDAVQAYGRVAISGAAHDSENTDSTAIPDMIALSAHKIHGPKGIGALWLKDDIARDFPPLIVGGAQEEGMRAGTVSPSLCVGFGAAAAVAAEHWERDHLHCEKLWQTAHAVLNSWSGAWELNGAAEPRYRGNFNIRLHGVNAARLLSDVRGVAFSLGSACGSGSGQVSHVLRAMGYSEAAARESIRLGWGRYTSEEALIAGLEAITNAATKQLS